VLTPGWIKDGTWPMDPKTRRPLAPPDSPFMAAQNGSKEVAFPTDGTQTEVTEDETQDDGLIGEDDLHVGGDVWRGAEKGLVNAGHG